MSTRSYFPVLALAFLTALAAALLLAGGSRAATEVVTEDWVVDSTEMVRDTVYELHANMTVAPTGQISCQRCEFRFMSTFEGEFGLVVRSGGYLLATDSVFRLGELSPGDPAEGWRFRILAGGRLSMQRSEVWGVGVVGGQDSERGLAISSDNVWISNSTFKECHSCVVVLDGAKPNLDGNTFSDSITGMEVTGFTFHLSGDNTFVSNMYGVHFQSCIEGLMDGGTFTDNNDAIRASDATVTVTNVTIDGLSNGVRADVNSNVLVTDSSIKVIWKKARAAFSSHITLLDCEVGSLAGFTEVDDTSSVRVRHSIRFKVIYAVAEVPVPGAEVVVRNSKGTKVWNESTDDGGLTPVEAIEVFHHVNDLPYVMVGPFSVIASSGYNYEEIEGFDPGPHHVEVVQFVDDIPPELTVTSPGAGAVLNTTVVTFRGRASDTHSGLVRLYYTINGGEPQELALGNPWQTTVELPEGELTLAFVALDGVGLNNTIERTVVVDVTPPEVHSIDPPSGSLTRAYQLLVTGLTEPSASVRFGERELTVDENGSFEGYLDLGDEEGEQTVVLSLTDDAGNSGTFEYTLFVDRTRPQLVVDTQPDHRDFAYLNTTDVFIFGSTDEPCNVLVKRGTEELVNTTTDDELGWYGNITLVEGENDLLVEAWDTAGNLVVNEIISYFYDDTPPWITVYSPENGTETKGTSIVVEVRTEPDASVWIVQGEETIQPGFGNVELEAAVQFEGDNAIVIHVRDKAGNHNSTTVHVVRLVDQDDGDNGSPGVTATASLVALLAAASLLVRARGRRR